MPMDANRTELEMRAHLGDIEAGIRLLRLDARHGGSTATVEVEAGTFGISLRIDGWYYGGGYLSVEEADEAFTEDLENGQVARQLLNWASLLGSGQTPFWWPRCCEHYCCEHHSKENRV
jgi:hypothetical protein